MGWKNGLPIHPLCPKCRNPHRAGYGLEENGKLVLQDTISVAILIVLDMGWKQCKSKLIRRTPKCRNPHRAGYGLEGADSQKSVNKLPDCQNLCTLVPLQNK